MKKKVKLGLIIVFGLFIVIMMIVYTLQPMDVDLMTIESGDIYDYVEEDGTVISDHKVILTAKTSETVDAVYYQNGDRVNEGDVILKLDDTAVQSQIDQLSHQIAAVSDEKNLNLTSLKYQIRQQSLAVDQLKAEESFQETAFSQTSTLYDAGAVSKTEYDAVRKAYDTIVKSTDQAKSQLSSLNAQYQQILDSNSSVAALTSQLDVLKQMLAYTEVKADASGMITDFEIYKGDYVTMGVPLGEIIDPDAYKVETYVLTEDVYNLSVGDSVVLEITRNGEDLSFDGNIYAVEPTAHETVSALGLVEKRVKVTIDASSLSNIVKVGYDVNVKFISEYQLDAISIPKTAVFYYAEDAYVFKDEGGVAVETKIETSMDTDSVFVVSNGLEAGDIIVKNYKVTGLADGKRIK